MSDPVEVVIISTSGLAKVILSQPDEVKYPNHTYAYYYRHKRSGMGEDGWLLDHVAEMRLPIDRAVEMATKIVDAPPQPRRR